VSDRWNFSFVTHAKDNLISEVGGVGDKPAVPEQTGNDGENFIFFVLDRCRFSQKMLRAMLRERVRVTVISSAGEKRMGG
jgi:hypothetical protein